MLRGAIPTSHARAKRLCYRVLRRYCVDRVTGRFARTRRLPGFSRYCQVSGLPPSALHTSMAIERSLSSAIGPDKA